LARRYLHAHAHAHAHAHTHDLPQVGVGGLTLLYARSLPALCPNAPGVVVNNCCPGWCKSDMAGWDRPTSTAEEGADTPLFLALLPEGAEGGAAVMNGVFCAGRRELGW
jgi:hypothetical protein